METLTVEDRPVHIVRDVGGFSPTLYWGIEEREADEVEHVCELVRAETAPLRFTLAAFEVADWNRDFSPWEAPAVFGKAAFGGRGRELLRWLVDSCVPAVEGFPDRAAQTYPDAQAVSEKDPHPERYLVGYSLAGLFGLWGFYESRAFDGVACCSGSLWFPGWDAYVSKAVAPAGSLVYLSLGDTEEHAKNRVMATVGDSTRIMDGLLAHDPGVRDHTLVWNPGGHFSDPIGRTADGMAWLIEHAI